MYEAKGKILNGGEKPPLTHTPDRREKNGECMNLLRGITLLLCSPRIRSADICYIDIRNSGVLSTFFFYVEIGKVNFSGNS